MTEPKPGHGRIGQQQRNPLGGFRSNVTWTAGNRSDPFQVGQAIGEADRPVNRRPGCTYASGRFPERQSYAGLEKAIVQFVVCLLYTSPSP
ncbi:MAG: hypothetical protein N3G20_09290, partial [Verrucomicrobiae bacterium]|nr:hypothetical protein [Verrucomicrobiae bacterium]